jgi:hypothetical protein
MINTIAMCFLRAWSRCTQWIRNCQSCSGQKYRPRSHTASFGTKIDLDTRAFVVANMVDALGDAAALRRPRGLSLARANAESCKANSCVSCLLIRHCGSLINSARAQGSGLALFEALANSGWSIDAVLTPRWFSATRKLSAWHSPSRSGEGKGRGFPVETGQSPSPLRMLPARRAERRTEFQPSCLDRRNLPKHLRVSRAASGW